MKIRAVAHLVAAGTVMVTACSTSTVRRPAPETPGAKSVLAGLQGTGMTQAWANYCANCHGAGGEGGGAGTRSLNTREKFDQGNDRAFFDAIKNGLPERGMEAFGKVFSDAEVWGLVVHIRELQSRALRQQFGSPQPTNGVYATQHHRFKLETVLDTDQGLNVPWAVDWLGDGHMLVTNRPGKLVVAKGGKVVAEVTGTPAVVDSGQGGLLDVAVHPSNGWVYLSFSDRGAQGGAMTKVVRGKLREVGGKFSWTDQQTVFEAPSSSYSGSSIHFGCRIVFDPKGYVYFGIGERGSGELAQDLSKPNGKLYRVREDGSIPPDNPFVNTKDALPAIWSYGHRNPQGLALDLDGALWDTEHAPRGGDEVNLIEKGGNYGWPVISFGINYSDLPLSTPWPRPGQDFKMPAFRWLPSTGSCGLDVVRGEAFPQWSGDLIAGGLVGQNLDRLRMREGRLAEREELLHGHGRIRDVAVGPDGFVYLALNGPDKVVRLVPAP